MYCGVTWFDKFLEFYTKRLFLTPEGIVAVAPIIKFYFVTILKVIQMHTRIIYNIQSFIEGSHYNNGNVSSLWRIKKCISRNKLFCLIFFAAGAFSITTFCKSATRHRKMPIEILAVRHDLRT